MPRGTPNPKPPSLLLELRAYNEQVDVANLDYGKIIETYVKDNWTYRLVETDAVPCYDGTLLVRFDVMLGRKVEETWSFEHVDTLTMKMGGQPGPVSVAARLAATESVIYLLTGRLPVRQAPAAPAEPPKGEWKPPEETNVAMDDADQELVSEPAQVPVIRAREADGLPIFVDLYELGHPFTTRQVVDAVLDECAQFLETASAEQVTALGVKNTDLMKFIKDLGEEADVAELKKMVTDRREVLKEAALPPQGAALRRRAAANARTN